MISLTQIKPLAHAHEFAVLVGLEAGSERCGLAYAPDVDHATGEIAILGRGYAAHNFHALDVVGRDCSHVHAFVGHVAFELGRSGIGRRTRHILHVGIAVDGSAIDHKQGAERRNIIVGVIGLASSGSHRARLAQLNGVHAAHVGGVGDVTWQEFEQVGETGGLQVGHCLAVDAR